MCWSFYLQIANDPVYTWNSNTVLYVMGISICWSFILENMTCLGHLIYKLQMILDGYKELKRMMHFCTLKKGL